MNRVLARWNVLPELDAAQEILSCCGSRRWANTLAQGRPFYEAADLLLRSDRAWAELALRDWEEAFASHPRIGEKRSPDSATAKSAEWSSQEQQGVEGAEAVVHDLLRQGNELYERRFGRLYIVCATGKSAEEMLAILERRLGNDETTELREAIQQQKQITQLRLRKWLEL